MSLEEKKKYINPETCISVRESVLEFCDVDAQQIEDGRRWINIPEGISEIAAGAFDSYNSGDVVTRIYDLLVRQNYHLYDWKKRLRGRSFVKYKFPPEVQSIHKKAEYLLEKEKEVRLLGLYLPQSMVKLSKNSFPAFLERIEVDSKNENYMSMDGVLFSRDGKTLVRYPGYRDISVYEIPEGVETIAPGAFCNAFLRKLVIPCSVKKLEAQSFISSHVGELVLPKGLEVIRRGIFAQSCIKKLHIPDTVVKIEDYAFEEISGIESMICESEEISMGAGIFKGSQLKNVDWWCWGKIPKAAFLNASLERIVIPEGVVSVGDYAFAGCYKAKEIVIPDSVQEIGPHSFDEGHSYDHPVKVPEHLYKYAYRLPARSKINGKVKTVIWSLRKSDDFTEEKEVLSQQKESLLSMLGSMNFMQGTIKRNLREQIKAIDILLEQA